MAASRQGSGGASGSPSPRACPAAAGPVSTAAAVRGASLPEAEGHRHPPGAARERDRASAAHHPGPSGTPRRRRSRWTRLASGVQPRLPQRQRQRRHHGGG